MKGLPKQQNEEEGGVPGSMEKSSLQHNQGLGIRKHYWTRTVSPWRSPIQTEILFRVSLLANILSKCDHNTLGVDSSPSSFLNIVYLFIFTCRGVLTVCMSVYHMHAVSSENRRGCKILGD